MIAAAASPGTELPPDIEDMGLAWLDDLYEIAVDDQPPPPDPFDGLF